MSDSVPSDPAAGVAGSGAANAPDHAGAASAALLRSLGLTVLERGWLSANQAVFGAGDAAPASVVDTGFASHAAQTLALLDHALAGAPLGRILNTHLHSDHCGGNAALQARGGVSTWIPAPSMAAVANWDDDALSFRMTGQACSRFVAEQALVPGGTIVLGTTRWQIHAAPGHDMDAVMLFEPQTRTLIAGDALWEQRLAIIFPELVGDDGFGPTRATLALIERLCPRTVLPGHGRVFDDVEGALAASRERVAAFERQPDRHAQHAARALLMFHLLEVRESTVTELLDWMLRTPIYRTMARSAGVDEVRMSTWAAVHLERLVDDGVMLQHADRISVQPQAH